MLASTCASLPAAGLCSPGRSEPAAHAGTVRHKLMPFWFGPPALSKLDTTLPYSTIERSIRRDATTVVALIAAAFVLAVLKLCRIV